MASQTLSQEPIAIVGSGCRLPGGSSSPSALWKLLHRPRDVSKEIAQSNRFDTTGYYHPNGSHHGTTNVQHSYLLEDESIRHFDAGFFNISPNEADSMDPQQRLLLETVYEALEAGGHTIEALRGSDTAVYVGTMSVDWNDILLRDVNSLPTYSPTGTSRAIISNRVSYFFDWHGPSMTIDTACSSSMIAVHQGVQALQTGESRVAVACGTQVILGPEPYIMESKMKMLSPTGRSRMWDADADGYARGEAVAAIVLKRLSDALADGDHIECLVRATGTNQDGHSSGLTVPSTEAQAALIQKTYAKAGLDPLKKHWDRPQFFEAHGTGTKAGDPREAAAISQCFGVRAGRSLADDPLYVGSIKTVIGHTEGAAGISSLLKASAMIQNGIIAPNLLFNRLNPEIEEHYQGLHVPTSATAWPKLPVGVPRRVSVNSFGFGGSNAHCILEEYRPASTSLVKAAETPERTPFSTFIFSAASDISLASLLLEYSDFVKTHDNFDAGDLAWTLRSRRSQFPLKVAFSAASPSQLADKIDAKLAEIKGNAVTGLGTRAKPIAPRVLGVFTGQGAQWPTMGAQLIRSSSFVRKRLSELEDSLNSLPISDRPQWRLQDQILAAADVSRLGEAELSQPLCTAVQVVLVDLLHAAGITFQAVVGHSSGEIAAAYAAGFLSAHDAIRIAYYRGFHSTKLAGNPESGQKGAMLAIGASWEEAEEFINRPEFGGRIQIAAHNSSNSITLSGDADVVLEASKTMNQEKKFARMLKVDTAYHSHHMLPCGDPYIQSLQECGVQVNRQRNTNRRWFSSVLNGKEMGAAEEDLLHAVYWRDNMAKPVLFVDAVKSAIASDDRLNFAIEVGPHPALKGPATQTISETRSVAIPYTGVLFRAKNDSEAFSDALGLISTSFSSSAVDFDSFENVFSAGVSQSKLVTGLPSYQWDHGRSHWHESRKSRKIRSRKSPFHELLGVSSPDSTERDRRWSNLLKMSEVPWIEGHQLQGQPVFPAAGYVVMALEAARSLAGDKPVELFEVNDLAIGKAITFEEDVNSAVETLVTLTSITAGSNQTTTADFACYAGPNLGSEDMGLVANGTIKVVFGSSSIDTLSSTQAEDYNMSEIDTDRFYSSLHQLGYGYSGPFRALSSLKRRFNQATGLVSTYPYTEADSATYLVHPTTLDVAFQSAILAFSAPGDERLWSLHVPVSIRSIRINPGLCTSLPISSSIQLPLSSQMNESDGGKHSLSSSVDVFSQDGLNTLIQVEDLAMKAFAPATAADDPRMLSYTKWGFATPDGPSITRDIQPSGDEVVLGGLCERLSYAYLRKWKAELTDEEWANGQEHHRSLRDFMNYTLATVSSGKHPCVRKAWSNDTLDDVKALIRSEGHEETIDIKLLHAVGENIPATVRGETTILEHMLRDNMLDIFYKKGLGFERYNSFLAGMMEQVTHRYPHAKIVEIGAGTGGATKSVLEHIGSAMSSYTYTDVSVGFFPKAAELFKSYSDKMTFKKLDVEESPESQGYEPHSYDIVLASNCLHATASLQRTLEHTRQLLKPGGYLLLLELTNNGPIRVTNIMGGLPGWWIGRDDGRKYGPTVTAGQWHTALRKAGFAGVDAVTPDIDTTPWPMSIIASQAVDDRVNFLRRPLSLVHVSSSTSIIIPSLIILGTGTLETARLADELSELLGRYCGQVTVLDGLPSEADEANLGLNAAGTTFINLVDLDAPIFKNMTAENMAGLKKLYDLSRRILWITRGAQADEPYHMASTSFNRVISNEARHISLNHLDISDVDHDVSKVIAEQLLRQCALDDWELDAAESQLLWSKEPEMFFDQGLLKVPRLSANRGQTNRLKSARCAVADLVALANSNVSIVPSSNDSSPKLMIVEETHPVAISEDNTSRVRIESSSLMALNVSPDTFLFLGAGKLADGSKATDTIVALSTTNSSQISPVASVKMSADMSQGSDALLIAVASEILAESLIQVLPPRSSVLVHGSAKNRFFATALEEKAVSKQVRTVFTCGSESDGSRDPSWIELDARAPRHITRKILLPLKPAYYIDLTSHPAEDPLSVNIAQALSSSGCKQIAASDLCRHRSSLPAYSSEALISMLQDAVSKASKILETSASLQAHDDLITGLEQIHKASSGEISCSLSEVLHWPLDGTVKVQVNPLDPRRLFSQNKSYLLAGLTGQLGQSLCEWMIRNGAGCVILTSRRPKIDARWLDSFKESGATVKVLAMDVTDKENLETVVSDIRASCPPIAGVAHGAMVLYDQLFTGMSLETMQAVLGPKIDGANNLDELFYNDDLDFFVMLSSLALVIGNQGQSNYVAANGYLNSLTRQRRMRGLAASAIDIGRVAGVGYMESANQATVEQLTRVGLGAICESDFHQMFGETIQAGHSSRNEQAVVTTGIRTIRDDEDLQGPWFSNPLFSHCVVEAVVDQVDDQQQGKKASLPVSRQLANAANADEAVEVLKECFSNKMRILLQIGDKDIDIDAPLVELGVDSLVAVEVRSWFLKELKADVPVLKVLGGSSLSELCQAAMAKLPEDLVASIGTGSKNPVTPVKEPLLTIRTPSENASSATSARSESPVNGSSSGGESSGISTQLSTRPPSVAKQRPTSGRFIKTEPLSFGQSRFWFLRLLLQDQTTFNVNFYYQITGNLRVADLERAFRTLCARHEALRTCFVEDPNQPGQAYQKVMDSSPMRLEHKTIGRMEDVATEYADLKDRVFDIANGELMRLVLLTLRPNAHYLLISYHHILMDGFSFQVFLADLEKAYNGQPLALGPPPRQFPDYSRSQREAYENGELEDDLQFWKGVFPDSQPPILPLLPMAQVSSRMPMKNFAVHQVECHLSSALAARVKSAAQAQRCTPFHFYLGVFKTMLFLFTDVEDLTIGIADANRNDSDVMGTIGFFLNLLTLRFSRQANQRFSEAIVEARNKTYEALGHSRLPFDVLLNELNVPRSSAYSPFFQAFFDYRQGAQEKHAFGNVQFEVQELHPGRTAYDITLDVTGSPTDALIMFRAQKGLYDRTGTKLLLDTYVHLLELLSSNASLALQSTALFSEKQLTDAIELGRGPRMVSDWLPTLPQRIDQIATQHPETIALMDGFDNTLTYSEMIDRTEAISEALLGVGAIAGSRVLVFEEAASDWVCSMLAIMRIGAIYVPLDLRNPLPRLATVAVDCQPTAVLTDRTTVEQAAQLNVPSAAVIDVSQVASKPSTHVPNCASANSPAAILYTSGSTGTPKGISVTHAGLRNEIEGYTKTWKLGAERALQQSAFTFNHSSDQIYTGLVNGGTVYIVPWSKRGDPLEITKIMKDQSITYTKATPSEYSLWMQFGSDNLAAAANWRCAFGGGEPLTTTVLREFERLGLPHLRFFNSYGPTEISISSHKKEIDYHEAPPKPEDGPAGRIPCGYSLPNYYTYILDEQLKPVPAGMPGEVVLGGAGVSLGYLNNEELTAKHFVPDPYAPTDAVARGWQRMYRTGDIGHMQEDGAMVFHNRMAGDTQIKIRGLRIEISDIESNILAAAGGVLREAAVTLRKGDPDFLVAHVSFAPQHAGDVLDKEAFLEHLLSHLPIPQYMVPVVAIPLDRLPLTNHSKVDRKAISSMQLPQRKTKSSAVTNEELTETMIQLRHVWQDVLGNKDLGFDITPDTSFFLVGGNSLLVIRLQAHIREVFNVVLRLVELLGSNTLGEMARQIEESPVIDQIDWDKETAPPAIPTSSFQPNGDCMNAEQQNRKKTVLITGATGFLARQILPQLAANSDIGKIHCVAVREKPAESQSRSLLEESSPDVEVVSHSGDLASPMVGLSATQFANLSQEADLILHMGAVHSFWDSYHTLRPANVHATRELVKLAAPRRIPIHYISSVGVLPIGSLEASSTSAAAHEPPADGSNGYVATRWASERILERSAAELGLPAIVHRFTPTTEATVALAPVLEEFSRFAELSQLMPDFSGWSGRIDLIAADEAARWLSESINLNLQDGADSESAGTGTCQFRHRESAVAIDVGELTEHLNEHVASAQTLPRVQAGRWVGRIKGLGFGYLFAGQETVMQGSGAGAARYESRR